MENHETLVLASPRKMGILFEWLPLALWRQPMSVRPKAANHDYGNDSKCDAGWIDLCTHTIRGEPNALTRPADAEGGMTMSHHCAPQRKTRNCKGSISATTPAERRPPLAPHRQRIRLEGGGHLGKAAAVCNRLRPHRCCTKLRTTGRS